MLATAETSGPIANPVRSLSQRSLARIWESLKVYGLDQAEFEGWMAQVDLSMYGDSEISRIQQSLPALIGALCGRAKNAGSQTIDARDLPQLTQLFADRVAKEAGFTDIQLTIGMGGAEDYPSIRLPAYLASALHSLQGFHRTIEAGPPTIRVFKATHISSALNGFDLERTKEATKVTFDFLAAFVGEFFPDLLPYFIFDEDLNWIESDPDLKDEIQSMAGRLLNAANIRSEMDSLKRMGAKHGGARGAENALLYAATHPYYNQSVSRGPEAHPLTSHMAANPAIPAVIIDHGGRPQELFNQIGWVARALSEGYVRPPLLTIVHRHTKIPPYYLAKNGDFRITDPLPPAIRHSDLDPITIKDHEVVAALAGSADAYFDFLRRFRLGLT